MNRTLTRLRIVSLYAVTTIAVITIYSMTTCAQPDTVWATTRTCEWEMQLVDSVSVDYLPIQHSHERAHPFSIHPLCIYWVEDITGCNPCYNPGIPVFSPEQVWIMTCDWWVPYPNWPVTDHDIDRVVNATNFDGNLDGVPDWIEFDYNADGFCNLSDLSWFGAEYGDGQRWDLSDFSAMGMIYNSRRAE